MQAFATDQRDHAALANLFQTNRADELHYSAGKFL